MEQRVFLGPPGTGKTTKLLGEVDDLMKHGVDPQDIAFVSFTRKAAHEARDRALEKFTSLTAKDLPNWGTLHSIAFKKLHLGRHDVMNRENWMEIANQTGFEMYGYYNTDDGALAGGTLPGDKYLFHYGLAHARMMTPSEYHSSLRRYDRHNTDLKEFQYFCDTLALYKAETGLLDFNDMIEHALVTGPLDIKVAIVDEAQDLSKRQWMLVNSLFENAEQIIIAGDDDQSIFEWSGADVPTFLDLKGTKTVLDKSYRCPRSVFNFANNIAARITNRIDKVWHPDDREGVVKNIAEFSSLKDAMVEDDGKTWLILARNLYVLKERVAELRSWGVPYSEKGKPAVKMEELRAIKAYEKCRAGNEIGFAEAQWFYNFLHGGIQIKRGHKQLPEYIPEAVTWDYLVSDCGLQVDRDLEWFRALKIDPKQTNYYRAIRRHGYATGDKPKVNVSTIHSVKGGEADNVVVIDAMARRTFMEMQDNPDAEHRVWYVAVTRAREQLFILQTGESSYYDFTLRE